MGLLQAGRGLWWLSWGNGVPHWPEQLRSRELALSWLPGCLWPAAAVCQLRGLLRGCCQGDLVWGSSPSGLQQLVVHGLVRLRLRLLAVRQLISISLLHHCS